MNIVLRDKGLEEEELVLWKDEALEFIRCCCATAVGGSISPFNTNTLGYVELNYALTTGIPYALIKNSAGNFTAPSLNSTQAAVSNSSVAKNLPAGYQSWTKVYFLLYK